MKSAIKILTVVALVVVSGVVLSSCQQKFYEEEQYRNEIYLVSGDNNIFGQEFEFGGDEGYVSVYYSGTVGIREDVTVTLAKDHEAVAEYNKRNFDQDYNQYALEVPHENFEIENPTVILKPGSNTPYSLCPVKVTTNNLLPDQTYFIPLRIESVSNYMASPAKSYVLMQVFLKNDYATTRTSTYYIMNGLSQEGSMSGSTFVPSASPSQTISASKLIVPVGKHSIRIMPAAKSTDKGDEKRNWGITATVDPLQTADVPILDEDGLPSGEYLTMQRVTLKPYKDSQDAVQVQEINGKPSVYDPETRAFTLNYRYKIASENAWYEIKEIMYDTTY